MTHPVPAAAIRQDLHDRLLALWERTGDLSLRQLALGEGPFAAAVIGSAQRRDWISTCLMNAFRQTRDAEALALLHDLHRGEFLRAIRYRLRLGAGSIDAHDVLQEVFLNIMRYPHHFHPDRAEAFRVWALRIVRNTVLSFLTGRARQMLQPLDDGDVFDPVDARTAPPDRAACDREDDELVARAHALFLMLYLAQFQRLPARQQRGLALAEVEGKRYRDIGVELGIAEGQVKMLVFRSRQRIFRGLQQALAALADPVSCRAGACGSARRAPSPSSPCLRAPSRRGSAAAPAPSPRCRRPR